MKPKFVDTAYNAMKNHPLRTAGAGAVAGFSAPFISEALSGSPERDSTTDEMLNAISNPFKANTRQNVNTGVGLTAAGIAGTALYQLLAQLPIMKKRKLLHIFSTIFGAGVTGYTAWKMSNNYQKNS